MAIGTLKTKRVLLDAVIDPCLCNLVVWIEETADASEIHVGECCASCRRLALKSIHDQYGGLPVNFVE
jgi:hypothetical protein